VRIISKFHDYYDCIQKYGQDDGMMFIRNQEDIYFHKYPNMRSVTSYTLGDLWYIEFNIGFAGKVYQCFEFHGIGDYGHKTF
jgi:hypothetical protein